MNKKKENISLVKTELNNNKKNFFTSFTMPTFDNKETEKSTDLDKPSSLIVYNNKNDKFSKSLSNLTKILFEKTLKSPLILKKKEQEDEKEPEIDRSKFPLEYITHKIETIEDLIKIGKLWESNYKQKEKRFNIDIRILHKLVKPLTDLSNMIGLQHVKKQIFNILIYYLQNLDNKHYDILNTVLEGPPGVGKLISQNIIWHIFKYGYS